VRPRRHPQHDPAHDRSSRRATRPAFAKTLRVTTLAPLAEPESVFAGLPAVDTWRQDGPRAYVLVVSDPVVAAPAVTRALVAADADVLSISESHHSLEEVYLELIGEDVETHRG
jgi:ABC-2 type transport system ATP-binding protein